MVEKICDFGLGNIEKIQFKDESEQANEDD